MALPSRIKDDGIHVFDFGLPFILYGRYLGESKTWFAIQSFLPSGVPDSVIVARQEDLDAIEIDGDRLRAVREFAGPLPAAEKKNPDRLLTDWVKAGSLLGLELIDEDDLVAGVILEMGDEWFKWRGYSRTGTEETVRLTPTDSLRTACHGGEFERRVERNAGVLSIQKSMETLR